MTTTELAYLDASAQADLVRRGELSPAELVDAAIARIERLNPTLNAVIIPLFEKARAHARAAALPDGPFRGVPFLLKDLDVLSAGDPYHGGTRFLRDAGWVAPHDSHLVEKYRAAGFVVVGKTNTPEFGLNVTTEPQTYGASHNPWNTAHSTGGSSGGSGAAVAAGMVPAAHASDGGGSIRIPASECGLVGLKPSRGRVSLGPEHGEYWHGLVISHAVTRSVRDSAAILDVSAGAMPGDPYSAPPPVRPFSAEVGAPPGACASACSPTPRAVRRRCIPTARRRRADVARLLESLGHHVDAAYPQAMDDKRGGHAAFHDAGCQLVEHEPRYVESNARAPYRRRGVEPTTWLVAEMGREVSAPAYLSAVEALHAYTRRMASWWASGFDVLLSPTLGEPPPRLGELVAPADNPLAGLARSASLVPFTAAFNITGQPAVSLPLCWNAAGLPIGVQLVAAYGREDLLFRVAAQLEAARPWAQRRPAVHA